MSDYLINSEDKKLSREYKITVSEAFCEKTFKIFNKNVGLIKKMTVQRMQCHQDFYVYDFVIEFKQPQEFIFVRELFPFAHLETPKI